MDKRERTVSYRRALWLNDDPKTISLERCVRDTCDKLKATNDRAVIRGDGQIVSLLSVKSEPKNGIFLHLTVETPGETASIVPELSKTKDELEVTTTPPPDGHDFMDGDAFIYINRDDLCLCSTGMRDGGIAYFLKALFSKAKIRKDSDKFDLVKAADLNKVKLIEEQGIKEIELKAAFYKASADYNRRKSQPTSILSAASKQFRLLFGKDNDVTDDALNAILIIKVDRRRKGLSLGEKRIEQLAKNLVKFQEAGDDFIIVTKSNQKISADEIFIRSTIQMEKMGKSVARESAWKELKKFYRELAASGALET